MERKDVREVAKNKDSSTGHVNSLHELGMGRKEEEAHGPYIAHRRKSLSLSRLSLNSNKHDKDITCRSSFIDNINSLIC